MVRPLASISQCLTVQGLLNVRWEWPLPCFKLYFGSQMSVVRQVLLLAPAFSTPERLHFPLSSVQEETPSSLACFTLASRHSFCCLWGPSCVSRNAELRTGHRTSKLEPLHCIMSSVLFFFVGCFFFWSFLATSFIHTELVFADGLLDAFLQKVSVLLHRCNSSHTQGYSYISVCFAL